MFFNKTDGGPPKEDPPYYPALRAGDYVAAIPLLLSATRKEDSHAMAVLGSLYALGRGVEQDPVEAALWVRQAAVRGAIDGQCALGTFLSTGLGCEVNVREGAYWLYQSATKGYRKAATLLSDVVLRNPEVVGEHFTQDDFDNLMRRLYRRTVSVNEVN